MAFQTKVWRARQGVGLNKFSIGGAAPVTVVNVPDQVLVAGDAFSEENMNDLERRIALACSETYGVKIDKANSNPETAVTYTDNAAGFTPSMGNNGSFTAGSWANKFPYDKIRPCLVKNGAVVGYLNPDNYAQFEDGTAADITSGSAGDVMVEIPKFYYKVSQDANYMYVQISDTLLDGFTDKAVSYKGVVKDKFYVGAYSGYVDADNKLRSLSGKTPTGSKTIGAFRTAAQANGAGYEQLNFYKLTALQILYLIRYKSLNSQIALGQGYVGGGAAATTGATNSNGMNYGVTSTTGRVKCNGIEDFWGNVLQWVDGYKAISGTTIRTADGNFNDTANGYEEYTKTGSTGSGYVKEVVGNNELGFTPHTFGGSSSTFYSDLGYLNSGFLPAFGGSWASDATAGAFSLVVFYSASVADPFIGARLLLCG